MTRPAARRRLTLQEMLDRNLPPRERLAQLVGRQGESYAALSRMIRRDDGYLARFVARGIPRRLQAKERDLLALYFRVTPDELGDA